MIGLALFFKFEAELSSKAALYYLKIKRLDIIE